VKKILENNKLKRKYKGEDSVYDAIISGEKETRSTVHIATEEFDEGPIVVQSKPFEIDQVKIKRWLDQRNHRKIRNYADNLQETMKIEGDGAAYIKAMEEISKGLIYINDGYLGLGLSPRLYYRGSELEYQGLRVM
jgi:folate-dependent phosphoribosylglycinamide formyltransferase PurN